MSEYRSSDWPWSGARTKAIWPHVALWLALMGRADSRHGEPAPRGDGEWTSPFVVRLVAKCLEHQSRRWLRCRERTAPMYVRLKRDSAQLASARTECERLSAQMADAAITPEEASSRRAGENTLDLRTVQRRREREHAAHTADQRRSHAATEAHVSQLTKEIEELRARISEHEMVTRLNCLRYANYTDRKIAIYWRRALRDQVSSDRNLPTPPAAPTLDSEYRDRLPYLTVEEQIDA